MVRTGEVLGAELLSTEVLGDTFAPLYADADVGSSSISASALATARVRDGQAQSAGISSTSLVFSAFAANTLSAPGVAAGSLSAAMVIPSAGLMQSLSASDIKAGSFFLADSASAGSSGLQLKSEALKDAVCSVSGQSSDALAAGSFYGSVAESSGLSSFDSLTVLLHPTSMLSEGASGSQMPAIGWRERIDDLDMNRPAEFRSMNHGPADSVMRVPPESELLRSGDKREMEVV